MLLHVGETERSQFNFFGIDQLNFQIIRIDIVPNVETLGYLPENSRLTGAVGPCENA